MAAGSRRPLVIAHRGASGQRPEHTLAAYRLALSQGADFIELDLVATSDGALIARHENALAMVALDAQGEVRRSADGRPLMLEATTDVAEQPAFADRLTVKSVDGRLVGGWFSEDFSLEEIRSLRARERLPELRPVSRLHDDRFGVPTLEDAIELVRSHEAATGRRAGVYLELKHPTFFAVEGRRLDGSPIALHLGVRLLETLEKTAFLDPERIFIQCFEVAPLIEIRAALDARHLRLPLIQLFGDVQNRRYRSAPRDMVVRARSGDLAIYGDLARLIAGGIHEGLTYADLASPAVLRHMAARYAAGIGPPRHSVLEIERLADGGAGRFSGGFEPLLGDALAAGLLIHPYTLRAEVPFLYRYQGRLLTVAEEAERLLEAGVDGFFIDQPDEGRLAVDLFMAGDGAVDGGTGRVEAPGRL